MSYGDESTNELLYVIVKLIRFQFHLPNISELVQTADSDLSVTGFWNIQGIE